MIPKVYSTSIMDDYYKIKYGSRNAAIDAIYPSIWPKFWLAVWFTLVITTAVTLGLFCKPIDELPVVMVGPIISIWAVYSYRERYLSEWLPFEIEPTIKAWNGCPKDIKRDTVDKIGWLLDNYSTLPDGQIQVFYKTFKDIMDEHRRVQDQLRIDMARPVLDDLSDLAKSYISASKEIFPKASKTHAVPAVYPDLFGTYVVRAYEAREQARQKES